MLSRTGSWRTPLVTASLLALTAAASFGEPIDTKSVPARTVEILRKKLQMTDAIAIAENSPDRSRSRLYLEQNGFNFVTTQTQSPMIMDGYSANSLSSPIIGYSLFYFGESGPLAIADASVNPLIPGLRAVVERLVATAHATVSNPDGSSMHFLGIQPLGSSRVLKIMIRRADTPRGPDYVVRYAISQR